MYELFSTPYLSPKPHLLGTLTQNVMIFKRLHLGTVSYTSDTMDEIQSHLKNVFNTAEGGPAGGNVNINSNQQQPQQQQQQPPPSGEGRAPSLSMSNTETPAKRGTQGPKMRRTVVTRVLDAVKAIAICHNVTPVYEVDPNAKVFGGGGGGGGGGGVGC